MAILFSGDQICSCCGCKYSWSATLSEKGEIVAGFINPLLINVKDYIPTRSPYRYMFKLDCPNCRHVDSVERDSESNNSQK